MEKSDLLGVFRPCCGILYKHFWGICTQLSKTTGGEPKRAPAFCLLLKKKMAPQKEN